MDAQQDLLDKILCHSSHELYAAIEHKLPISRQVSSPSVFDDQTLLAPSFRVKGDEVYFTIPRLGDRLLLGEEVAFQFVAGDSTHPYPKKLARG